MALDLAKTSDLLRALADPTRMRLLALLRREELSVAELVRISRLPQSRVSTHLAKLKAAQIVRDRRRGTSTLWSLHLADSPDAAEKLVEWVDAASDPLLREDQDQLDRLLRERDHGVEVSWADTVAGAMDRHYSPGRTWEATAWGTLGLARLGDVLDVASGDGVIAELLAPRARSVTCVDRSGKVAAAGARRLAHLAPHVRFERADMHALPFQDESFDQALLMNALTYADDPKRVLAELHRVLRPGGGLVAVTLKRHAHAAEVEPYNHLHLGFDPEGLREMLVSAGFLVDLCAVTSRERRKPHFEVITIHAQKAAIPARASRANPKRGKR